MFCSHIIHLTSLTPHQNTILAIFCHLVRFLPPNLASVVQSFYFIIITDNYNITTLKRALQIQWCVESDEFCFKIVIKERPPTRRGILVTVSSIYDPLGLLSPVILPAKFILQQLCRLKLGWDDKIPDEYQSAWLRWLGDFPKLSQLSISRCSKSSQVTYTTFPMHMKTGMVQCLSYDKKAMTKRFIVHSSSEKPE